MGRFGRQDAPRVVGFDFGPPVPAAPVAPVAPVASVAPVAPVAPPPPPPPAAPEAVAAEPAPAFATAVATLDPPAPPEWSLPTLPPGATLPPPRAKKPAARKGSARSLGGAVVTAILLLAGGARAYHLFDRLHAPSQVGGFPKIATAESNEAEAKIQRDLSGIDEVVTGTYGTGDQPRYILVAGNAAEDTANEAFDAFRHGIATDGVKVGASLELPGDVVCAKATSATGHQAVFCAWGGGRSDGLVFAFGTSDVAGTAAATVAARHDVEH
jgi:hypothetical protein